MAASERASSSLLMNFGLLLCDFSPQFYNYNKARELFRESLFASQVRYPTYEVLYLKCADPLTLSWPRADFNAAINGRVDVNE